MPKVKLRDDRIGGRSEGRGRDRNVLVSWSGTIVNVLGAMGGAMLLRGSV